MTHSNQPLYKSKRSWRNLWQQYNIFDDRIELGFLFWKFTVPMKDIVAIEVRPPIVIGDVFRKKNIPFSLPLKLDFADFQIHVAVTRRTGWIKHIRFTPDSPTQFVEICKSRIATMDC